MHILKRTHEYSDTEEELNYQDDPYIESSV